MNRQDMFLAITTAAIILSLAALTTVGVFQYQHDRDRFMNQQKGTGQ